MHTQIRLAERQGLLQGREISPVQAMAIFLLDRADVIEEDQRAERSLKEALLATGQVSFASLFPAPGLANESIVGGEDLDSVLDNEDDDTIVRYVAPDDEMTEEKMNELLMQLMSEANHGTLDGRTLRGEDGWM